MSLKHNSKKKILQKEIKNYFGFFGFEKPKVLKIIAIS